MSHVGRGVLVAVLVIGGAAGGWALGKASDGSEQLRELENRLAAARAERAEAEADLEATRHASRAAEREVAAARRRAESPPASAPAEPSAIAPDAAPATEEGWRDRVGRYPVYPFADTQPEIRDALEGVEWVTVAENMSAMVPVAREITAAIVAGETPSGDAIGRSQAHNGPLVTVAMRLHANGVPGTGANGAFTHPAFFTNALAASLEALELPLDAAQRERLGTVGEAFARREAERVAGLTDGGVALRRLCGEAELKREFVTAAFEVLTVSQRDALRPEPVRGRVAADLFSAGLVWVGRAHPLLYRDRAHLAELLELRIAGDVEDATRARMHPVVRTWIAALPEDLLTRKPDALDRMGMIDSDLATRWGGEVLRLVDALLRDTTIDEGARSRLRDLEAVPVPFHDATE